MLSSFRRILAFSDQESKLVKIHIRKENTLLLLGVPSTSLALPPGHSPSQALAFEGRTQRLESWLMKAK